MRAMTVIPGRPDSAELTERPEPEPKDGELLVEPLYLGVCGTDREILDGDHGEPPPGERAARARPRAARAREGGGRRADRRARRRDRPPPRPRAVRVLRERRVGHVPERPVHRARHQAARRLRRRARDDRGGLRDPGPDELGTLGVLTEPASILAKAWEQIDRISTRACSVHERVAGHRRRPDRPARRAHGQCSATSRCTCSTARPRASSPRSCKALGAEYHTGDITEVAEAIEPDVVVECTGVAELVAGAMRHTAPGRDRLPDRGGAVAQPQRRHRRAEQRAGARERRGVRLGQRQPAPFRAGGRSASRRRPRLASPADHAHGPARRAGRRRSRRATTTSRSWSSSPER